MDYYTGYMSNIHSELGPPGPGECIMVDYSAPPCVTHKTSRRQQRMELALGLPHVQAPITGFEFDNQYYMFNDVFEDEEMDFEEPNNEKTYCGFSRNFLANPIKIPPSHSLTPPAHISAPYRISHNNDERMVKILAKEGKKCREKAEKKKHKKMKQKKKKQCEKLDREHQSEAEAPGSVARSRCSPSPGVAPSSGKLEEGPGKPSEDDDIVDMNTEELDMSSSFVSNAAVIVKRKLDQRPKPDRKNTNIFSSQPKDKQQNKQQTIATNGCQNEAVTNTEDVVIRSRELAVIGNQYASAGCFNVAVQYFTDAIKHNPVEFRLFGNRSFCYEKMQEFEKSLIDANVALSMSPGWVKGLYRKGRALTGLKRYEEAAWTYGEVLRQDSMYAEARQELLRVQIAQLMEMGYSQEQSSNSLIVHGSVENAHEALSSLYKQFDERLKITTSGQSPEEEQAISGIRSLPQQMQKPGPVNILKQQALLKPIFPGITPLPQSQVKAISSVNTLKTQAQLKSSTTVKTKPTEPQPNLELFPIWVGNLALTITQSMIQDIFSFAGDIFSVKMLYSRRCAFINYTNKESCEKAISVFHGVVLQGTKLTVRFPDRIPANMGMSKSAQKVGDLATKMEKSSHECFFWRNMGCTKKGNCIYRHVPENKGIDMAKGNTSVP